MVELNPVRMWGITDFSVTEGHITNGSAECVWCHKVANVGEFVMIVQENGHTVSLVMHPKCLPPDVRAARFIAVQLAHNDVRQELSR